MKTFWNGEPCKATKVKVIVGKSPLSSWWCSKLAGKEHTAIRIEQHEETFYINDDVDGWNKITEGLGMWTHRHRSLPVEKEIT